MQNSEIREKKEDITVPGYRREGLQLHHTYELQLKLLNIPKKKHTQMHLKKNNK